VTVKRLLPAVVLVALAAGGRGAAADEITLPFQVADRMPALRLVTDFERASRNGDWTTAADRLQQLLDLPPGDPVVIRAVGMSPARFEGSTVVARRLFDRMPREGRDAWEARSRARAEELLARGMRLRRDQDLAEAARRYPAADVRRRAFDALAQFALAKGDLRAARFHLESLLDAAEEADRPHVIARLAWVAAQAGDVAALAALRVLGERDRDVVVPASPSPLPLSEFLERMTHAAGAGSAAEGAPRVFGGDASGSGLSEAPAAPGEIAWPAPTEFMQGYDNDPSWPSLSGLQKMRRDPVVPVVSRGLVFLNTGLSLVALNLSNGGTAWRHDSRHQEADWRDSFVASQTVAVAGGTAYAALVTRADGVEPGVESMFANKRIIYALPHRCLHAFDERTGELLWSHESSKMEPGRPDAAEVDRESVSSPPLVIGDDLIVTAWTYRGIYDVRVVCYDRRTGATRWRTSIAQGQQELNLFGRPVKELVTGAIGESGGLVYFATGLGVAAAVHREDGRIVWLTAYPQMPIPPAMHWYETRDREVGWWMSPVYASPEAVVMAPLDSPDLLCLAPATGELRWRAKGTPSRLQRYRWFLGVTGGRAYVLGTQLAAFDLAQGSPVWTGADAGRLTQTKVSATEATGRGILTKDRVYAPTERAIVAVNTATGAAEETWPLKARQQAAWATGNLVSGDGALLVVTASRIDAYWRAEDLRARVDARLAAQPEDPQTRLDAAEFYASVGEIDLAIRTLTAAFDRLPQVPARARERLDERLRHALYTSYLARADMRRRAGDASGAVDDLRSAAEAARDRGDRVRALFALATALEEAGKVEEAEASLRRVASELADIVTATEEGERAHAGALAAYRLGEVAVRTHRPAEAVARWLDLLEQHADEDLGDSDVREKVRERLHELGETQPDLVRTAVRARAQRAFDAAKAARDVAALDRAARLYPDPTIAAEAALLAADLHLEAGRARDAIGVLTSALAEPQPEEVTARALWKLAAAYRVLGETARERATLRRLAREAPDVAMDGGVRAADAVQHELGEARFRDTPASVADPRAPLAVRWKAGSADQTPPQALRLAGSVAGERALDGRMVLYQFGTVSLVESATGKPVWERPTRVEVRTAALAPGAIVVAGEDTRTREGAVAIVALSLADGRELWRQQVPGKFRASETTLGVMYLLVASRGTRPNYSMAAVSLSTGDLLQARSFEGVLNPQMTTAEDAIVVTQQARGKDGAQRAVITLDGTTLARRGQVDVSSPSSPFYVHPALSSVVVTTDGADLVATDIAKGDTAWRQPLADGKAVKAVFGLPGALIVSDEDDALRRLEADTGRQVWRTPLSSVGNLVYQGEAAEGDTVIATLKPKDGKGAYSVALDAATGTERWRRRIELADENTIPRPAILGALIAYELNERLDRGMRSRVVLLDRATGQPVQELEHETIGKTYQIVTYGPDWIALSSANEIAVYGGASDAK
jgi:outer membrane protein assembly factor BamB/tetratricopeptide (TPR) repeat protein